MDLVARISQQFEDSVRVKQAAVEAMARAARLGSPGPLETTMPSNFSLLEKMG